jgi:hypothetical protein
VSFFVCDLFYISYGHFCTTLYLVFDHLVNCHFKGGVIFHVKDTFTYCTKQEARERREPNHRIVGMAPVNMYCAGLGNQSCDVVLVKGALAWENHKGSGFLNGKQMGNRWGTDGEGWK